MRKQNNFRRPSTEKTVPCGCGGQAKLGSRRNFPFGKNAKARRTTFYKCKSCGDVKILAKPSTGGRR